ncbi:MAG: NAD-dependent epimerase/dehydratase family protein [Bdellovibrionaceae bacterium]|nr:NAD-dependent epimerase/dehydratase family protein [Pseudobdellovibrionaceae bacterium]
MKALVTGGSGFLGGWLCKKLNELGVEIIALTRNGLAKDGLEGIKCRCVIGDVTDLGSLIAASKGVDVIFHLAGVVAYKPQHRDLMEKVNVTGTANMLRAAKHNAVPRFVHISSVVAVGAGFTPDQILDEKSPYNLGHLNLGYFETKRKAEELVRSACHSGEVNAVIVNPSTVYGPADAKKDSRRVQVKVAQGNMPFYPPGGVNVVSVHDVVEGIIRAWEKGATGERYILASENLTIKALFELIAKSAKVRPPRVPLPSFALKMLGQLGDIATKVGIPSSFSSENAWTATLYHWFKNDRARSELGLSFRPAEYAIEESVRWMRSQGLLN